MGSSNPGDPGGVLGPGDLAIPHGEFERHGVAMSGTKLRPRDPSWGVRTSSYFWRRRGSSSSRSLMGSSNLANPDWQPCSGLARDPSWGVRTGVATATITGSLELAIPHGEFEPACVGASNPQYHRSRSLMGSSNRAERRTCRRATGLAIPHGEFELVVSIVAVDWIVSRDPSWGVRTAYTAMGCADFSIFETFGFMTVRLHFCYATPHFERERWA